MTLMRTALTAAAVATLSASSVSAAPVLGTLADGTEFVFVRKAKAPQAALRIIVRAGGADDPPGREGLAHFLEHVMFHGNHENSEASLFADARAAGATLNAHTYPDFTTFEIDAPRRAFLSIAGTFLETMTSPALRIADLGRERGVISTESLLRGGGIGMLWLADQFLYPSEARGRRMIGSTRSRAGTTHDDLIAFFQKHYLPSNLTFVVVGDFKTETIKAFLEEHTRLAPARKEEAPTVEVPEANVPVQAKTRARFTATLLGYRLDGVSRRACSDLAALLEVRLTNEAIIGTPITSSVECHCAHMRGSEFVFAVAMGNSYESGRVPALLERVFQGVRSRKASAAESRSVKKRRLNARIVSGSARAIADAYSVEAGRPRKPSAKTRVDLVRRTGGIRGDSVLRAARRNFKNERKILIHFSPLEG